jgi:hypothetical protein
MIIDDALVAAITRELLKRLGSGEVLASAVKRPLVISGGTSNLQSATRSGLEAEYAIQWHDSLEADFPDNAGVLITGLSIQALVRLAEGDAGCTPEGSAVLWALLRGKRPVILEEGVAWRGFKDTLSPALTAKFNAHEKALASYGAVFAREADVLRVLTAGSPVGGPERTVNSGRPSPPVSVPPGGAKGKRVIGEVELMRLCPEAAGFGQVLELGAKDILTPLAKDYAGKMRITVNRTG